MIHTIEAFFEFSGESPNKVARWQLCGAIVQKPEGPNTYNLKIWLSPPGNLVRRRRRKKKKITIRKPRRGSHHGSP